MTFQKNPDPSKPTNVLSSLLIRAKPNSPQEPRVCLDSRIQNLITIKEATSLVGINEVLAHFSQASMVSQLDLSSAYFSIGLSEKIIPAFAFIHPISKQCYNFTRLAMGGKTSQASLETLMSHVLRRSRNCLNHSDDLFLVSKKGETIEEHLKQLRVLIEDLAEAKLKVKSKMENL